MDKSDKEFLKKNKDVLSYEEIIKLYKEGKITKEELEKKVKIRERFDKLNNDKEFEDYRNKEIAHAILDIGTALIPFGGGAKIGGKIGAKIISKAAPKIGNKVAVNILKGVKDGGKIGLIHGIGSAIIDNENPVIQGGKEAMTGSLIGGTAGSVIGKVELNKQIKNVEYLKPRREDWGIAYKKASGDIKLAIDTLLKNKKGFVPKAFYKEGIGDIDLIWGDPGAEGRGLAHIKDQREAHGVNLEEFFKSLSKTIEKGVIVKDLRHSDRIYIQDAKNKIAIPLDWNGKDRRWVITAHTQNKSASKRLAVSAPTSKPRLDSWRNNFTTKLTRDESIITPKKNVLKTSKWLKDKESKLLNGINKVMEIKSFQTIEKDNSSEKENKTIRLKGGISINYDGIEVDGKKYKDWSKKEKEAFWEGFSSNSFTNSKPYKSNIKIDNKTNNSKPRKMDLDNTDDGHWVTIDHRHVFIED